jgi:hypothetical protein
MHNLPNPGNLGERPDSKKKKDCDLSSKKLEKGS